MSDEKKIIEILNSKVSLNKKEVDHFKRFFKCKHELLSFKDGNIICLSCERKWSKKMFYGRTLYLERFRRRTQNVR